jgi:hypothetical protein
MPAACLLPVASLFFLRLSHRYDYLRFDRSATSIFCNAARRIGIGTPLSLTAPSHTLLANNYTTRLININTPSLSMPCKCHETLLQEAESAVTLSILA